MTLKQVIESIQAENDQPGTIDLGSNERKIDNTADFNTEEDMVSELGPDVFLLNTVSTELVSQYPEATTPSVSHVLEHREMSPPMKVDDLAPLQEERPRQTRADQQKMIYAYHPRLKPLYAFLTHLMPHCNP